MEAKQVGQPHAVIVPFPLQGHINPMLQLAKLLHHRGFHITFVNSEFNHKRFLRSRGRDALAGLPSFRFETIPDGLPQSDDVEANQDLTSLCDSTVKHCSAPFRDLLLRLNAEDVPPVTCVVADFMTSFTIDPAKECDVPVVLVWTGGVGGLLGFTQYRRLIEMGIVPLKDKQDTVNGYLDGVIDWIPALKGMRLKDLPSFMRITDVNDIIFNFAITEIDKSHNTSAIILNSFNKLDHKPLEALVPILPPIYTIGPFHLLLKHVPDKTLASIESNLWKVDHECLDWLDSKSPNSVLYVNFGSATVMTSEQLVELAWGLANSKKTFLWIIRPNLVVGESAILPPEFLEVTKERGFLASWCPQEEVLSHAAIGGFLTHSGWNSTLESISSGVPMICWPFYSEQFTNCWYCCEEWGIGIEMKDGVERDGVERLVLELMEKDKGKEMREKAMEWKRLAEEATSPTGSSHLNLEKVINQVLNSNMPH